MLNIKQMMKSQRGRGGGGGAGGWVVELLFTDVCAS